MKNQWFNIVIVSLLLLFSINSCLVVVNNFQWKDSIPDATTLTLWFRQNGYHSYGGRKIFHHIERTGGDRKDETSFDGFFILKLHAHAPEHNYNGYTKKEGFSSSVDWDDHDVVKQTDEFTVDYVNMIMAEHPQDKPLFLAAGIFRSHLPFWAPPASFKRYL